MFRRWRLNKTYRARPPSSRYWAEINDRQQKVEGYPFDAYQRSRIALIGVSGTGNQIGSGLAHKGARYLDCYDDDYVQYSGLARQPLFTPADVDEFKVRAAGKHLIRDALWPLTVTAYPKRFQECFTPNTPPKRPIDLMVAAVDNAPSRRAISVYCNTHNIPVLHVGVGRDANGVSVSVQEPGRACWGCLHPELLNDTSYPCGLPGIIDCLSIASGHVLYAADTIIGTRPRHWNRRTIYLDGGLPDRTSTIERNPNCPICSVQSLAA